jgi:hypothetical protein
MSINGDRPRLMAMTKELIVRWKDARAQWKDSKSLEFEKAYMETLLHRIEKIDSVSEKLDVLLNKARKDCE